ncbi:MAG TPA: non-homologous end-joining DNA ligase [Bdellovibrionota bacterium]|nr:non-homologous end-joining DNA ligase [Bdellovibrionota bacterium]
MKEKDEHAQSLRQGDVLLEKPLSIKTQRDLDDIGAGRKGVNQKAKLSPPPKRTKPKPHRAPAARERQQATERLRNLRLTHPEKVYYPDNDIRKIDILEYYVKASDRLLEHIADRPLMILRYPEGIERKGFVQKHWTRGLPAAIKKRKVRGEAEPYISVDSPEGLIALAQFGVLEIHTWNTTFAHIENPDQWVFDLDPDPHVPWNSVIDTAFAVRDLLKTYGLRSFVKTTGGKGLHVVAPVEPKFDWDLGKAFAKAVCEDIASSNPDLYLVNMSKAKRRGKIFLDYLRNGRGATAVAPYSPRARFGATLSIPVEWTELKRGLKSDAFTIRNIDRRLAKDPWKSFYQIKQVPKL